MWRNAGLREPSRRTTSSTSITRPSVLIPSRACRATSDARCRSSAASSSPSRACCRGDGGVLRRAAARIRVAEAAEPADLRAGQHRLLLRDPRALRGRRPRAAARGRQLRRPADHQHGLHSRWESELFERNRTALRIAPAARAPVVEAARLHVRRAAGLATACRPGCSRRIGRPPTAASSTTTSTSRRSRTAQLPVLRAACERVDQRRWRRSSPARGSRPAGPTSRSELPRTPRRVRRPISHGDEAA